jgi:hypothetical protein
VTRAGDLVWEAAGGALAAALITGAALIYSQRHLTARYIRRLEAAGRTDEAAAHRAVLHARAAR